MSEVARVKPIKTAGDAGGAAVARTSGMSLPNHGILAITVGWLAAGFAAGCDPGMCPGDSHDGYAPRCNVAGSATVDAPAHLGLLAMVHVKQGAGCLGVFARQPKWRPVFQRQRQRRKVVLEADNFETSVRRWRAPAWPRMIAHVGKSGPGTIWVSSSAVIAGFSI